MRKFILPAVLAVLSFTALPQAHASDGGWYANIGVGSTHFKTKYGGYSYSDNRTGSMFNVGWRRGLLGFELGYTRLGSSSSSSSSGGSFKETTHGFTAGLNLHYDINEKFYVGGRAGAFFWTDRRDIVITFGPGSGTYSTSSTGWYAGAGAGYNFTPNWSLGANYGHYRMSYSGETVDSDMYMATVEYRF